MSRKLKVEYVPAAELKADPRNSRTHSEAQIELIGRSIKEFGWTVPILIDEKQKVVAGHARLRAALLIGEKSVPVLRLAGLTPKQRRAYVIADNRIAQLATWDENVLSEELRSLMDDGFDISVLGYSEEDLQALEDGWAPDEGLLDTKEGTSESEAVVRVKCKYADVDKVVEAVRDAVKKSKLKDVEVVRP